MQNNNNRTSPPKKVARTEPTSQGVAHTSSSTSVACTTTIPPPAYTSMDTQEHQAGQVIENTVQAPEFGTGPGPEEQPDGQHHVNRQGVPRPTYEPGYEYDRGEWGWVYAEVPNPTARWAWTWALHFGGDLDYHLYQGQDQPDDHVQYQPGYEYHRGRWGYAYGPSQGWVWALTFPTKDHRE